MHTRHWSAALLLVASLAGLTPLAQAQTAAPNTTPTSPPASPLAGRWITESGNLEVEIAPCGDALCGTVVRVIANRSMAGPGTAMDPVDKRPALGMQILHGLRPADGDTLDGSIYNRENGKTYGARLSADGPQQMFVKAYVGVPLFGKTQLWRRAAAAGEVNP